MTHRRYLACFLGLLGTVSGCRVAELAAVDRSTYLVRENNRERRFQVVRVCTHLFPPVVPATARCYVAMVEKVPASGDTGSLSSIVRDTPPWRILVNMDQSLFDVVYRLTADQSVDRDRFIVGNHDPVIVALGVESRPVLRIYGAVVDDNVLQIGMAQRLVSERDLGSMVDQVILLDHGQRRAIALGPPITLSELLHRKPWEAK